MQPGYGERARASSRLTVVVRQAALLRIISAGNLGGASGASGPFPRQIGPARNACCPIARALSKGSTVSHAVEAVGQSS